MHVTEKKERVSLLSFNAKYLVCYGTVFSDWGSNAVKYKGNKTTEE